MRPRFRALLLAPPAAVLTVVGLTTAGYASEDRPAPREVVEVSTAQELHAALAAARPGLTIQLSDGIYQGNFKAYAAGEPGARVVLTGSQDAVLTARGGNGLHLTGASYWDIRGITISGGQKGVMLDASDHVVIDGVTVHDLGMEAVHFRSSSAHGVIRDSTIHDTGQDMRGMGEGVYVGSARDLTDKSDYVLIANNVIGPDVRGEAIDLKEGTQGGRVIGNHFDGSGLTDINFDDSWVDVKGNDYLIAGNTGVNTRNDGYQVHTILEGWGCGTVFRDNVSDLRGAYGPDQYAFHVTNYDADDCPTTVESSNTVTGGRGLASPGVPIS